MKRSKILENMFLSLPGMADFHAPGSKCYELLKQIARCEVERLFSSASAETVVLEPFGEIFFPYYRMGALDSLNLFDLDELIIFSYYWVNRKRYQTVLDIGANLGLHSIILHKCKYQTFSYEPDPAHFEILQENFALNGIEDTNAQNVAVSTVAGESSFLRVLGNTMSSHLVGAKKNPYGDLECLKVQTISFTPLMSNADLIKLDIEGYEKEVLLSTGRENWQTTDALVEVQCEENAAYIYNHFQKLGVGLFSQKKNWRRVECLEDMPTSYHDGTLFISCSNEMPWS